MVRKEWISIQKKLQTHYGMLAREQDNGMTFQIYVVKQGCVFDPILFCLVL